MLEAQGHDVETAGSFEAAIEALQSGNFDLVLCDILLGPKTGLDVLNHITGHHLSCQVVMMTGAPSAETAVEALRHGAYDYLTKPVVKHDLIHVCNQALQHKALLDDIHRLESEQQSSSTSEKGAKRESTSELQHALETIKQSEAKFRSIFETIQDVYFRTDTRGRIVLVSPSVRAFAGYEVEALQGCPITDVLHDASAWKDLLEQLHACHNLHDVEVSIRTAGGRSVLCSLNAHVLIGDKGHVQGIEGALRDITERKRSETRMIEQNQILEMLASGRPIGETLEVLMAMVERQTGGHTVVVASGSGRPSHRTISSSSLPAALVATFDDDEDRWICCGACGATGEPSPTTASGKEVLMGGMCPEHDGRFIKHGYNAVAMTPIRSVGGDVFGYFTLLFDEETGASLNSEVDHDVASLLQVAAHFAGIAMERQRTEDHLWRLSYGDVLTGLPNRRLMMDRLTQALSSRSKTGLAILFMDIDRFKMINDTMGHHIGDQLLTAVSGRLKACVRAADTVSRLGGDEFTIVLTDIRNSHDAVASAEKVLAAMAEPFTLEDRKLYMSASIGISFGHPGKIAPADLLQRADMAMYRAKERGNTYHIYSDEMSDLAVERMELETSLRHAIEHDEFRLFYQPQIDIRTGEVVGTEALIRWDHPEEGLIPPGRFIRIAEETGLIVAMDQWALKEAVRQNRVWMDMGYEDLHISVNLSAQHFHHPDLSMHVKMALTETGMPPELLDIEITESMAMRDPEMSITLLYRLREMGVQVSMDDFGTGYSSLSYLKRLPLNILKVDRSFVCDLPDDLDDAAIAAMIISMTQQLNLTVIAEGVETAEQLAFMHDHQCHIVQGYLFSKPVPADEMTTMLSRRWNVENGRIVAHDASEGTQTTV